MALTFLVHHVLLLALNDYLILYAVFHELALADVVAIFGGPHLVLEDALLALLVGVRAVGVLARVEPALDLDVRELAALGGAACSVAAEGHVRVPEGALRVVTVREELAVLFSLVRQLSGG